MKFLPLEDGVTHINIYTKAETELGRRLSNMFESSTILSYHLDTVPFKTLEGYWYFLVIKLSTNDEVYELQTTNGFQSKSLGKKYITKFNIDYSTVVNSNTFKEMFSNAIRSKIVQDKKLIKLLVESDLPFTHYYYYGDKLNPKVINANNHPWMIDVINTARIKLKEIKKRKINSESKSN